MAYTPNINLDKIAGIDVHVHAGRSAKAAPAQPASQGGGEQSTLQAMTARSGVAGQTLDETAAWYRERNLVCCIWGGDPNGTGGSGHNPNAVYNEEMLENAEKNNDVFIPFVMVDPWRGKSAARDAERLLAMGAQGFKFHPPSQGFFPNERRFYDLYEVIQASGKPALFHTGQTAVGQGTRGGGGIHLKYGNPIYLDDVAVDFPDMPIIMAHPSFPWQDEALSIAVCKPTCYIDLSGWSPKYFPPQLVQYSNTLLRTKVLFATDFPMITADRWLADFEQAGFRDEVKPLILKENAAKLLKLK